MSCILSRHIFITGRYLYKSSVALTCKVDLSKIRLKKSYSTDDKFKILSKDKIEDHNEEHNLATSIKSEYQKFRDEDADIIFDVDEEQKRLNLATINAIEQTTDPYEGLNMNHGIDGVFDIQDLVEILRKDKASNIFVATVPRELSYVDYIVIVTAKSPRHMSALATYIRKAYKLKKYCDECIPKIEGENSKEWKAIDLGNIALHIFSTETREKYDLETLWSVGPKYDSISNTPNFATEFKDRYSEYLAGFQPANESESESSLALA